MKYARILSPARTKRFRLKAGSGPTCYERLPKDRQERKAYKPSRPYSVSCRYGEAQQRRITGAWLVAWYQPGPQVCGPPFPYPPRRLRDCHSNRAIESFAAHSLYRQFRGARCQWSFELRGGYHRVPQDFVARLAPRLLVHRHYLCEQLL